MKPMWSPSEQRVNSSEISSFLKKANLNFNSYDEFHRYSVEKPQAFWNELINQFRVLYEGSLEPACNDHSFDSYAWYPNVRLNFAENLLRKKESHKCALRLVHESDLRRSISYNELYKEASKLQNALNGLIGKGDVLACYMPNIPETVISMLACSANGGVFTSTSADFGVEGVVDRFSQSKPKILVAASHYQYNGKTFSLLEKLSEIEKRLPFLESIIIVDFLNLAPDISAIKKAILWQDFVKEAGQMQFERVSFSDPLYIMYSSGTTGKPKCIVHSVGGTLLQHIKELALHTNLNESKNIFYFTTCGWMMWNWLVSSLFFGSKVVLYEGSPGFPKISSLLEMIEKEEIHFFGTSPKFLKALQDSGYDNDLELASLESILSTGAPLLPEQFDFIYESIKSDVCISSISGGTDIIGCFMLGNPTLPVYRGEIQCLGLGMDVDAFDEEGKSIRKAEGELVCKSSFPSRPIYFLNDQDSTRIKDAYFDAIPGVWCHGDFIKITEHGGVIVYGRSDATLNPGGVRIGTAEIYRQTQQLSWLEDSLCVGQKNDGDVDVVLFIKMKEGFSLDEEKIKEAKTLIRAKTTPRHVPSYIYEVQGIPYTRSGKKMELAITRLLDGRELSNIEAVANPECLDQYRSFSKVNG